jgi:hypothetical protein
MARARGSIQRDARRYPLSKAMVIDADGGKRRAMEIRRSEKQTARQLPGGEHPRP